MKKGSVTLFTALALALTFMLAPSISSADDCIHMKIGDVIANPTEDILVPVYISDVTGWGVMAFEVTLCWCELPVGLIQLLGCEPGEVLINSGWTYLECNPCSPNCISVAAAGVNPLVGSGPLFYVKFHVSANAKPCMCCELWFTEIYLWDPENPLNVCPEGGSVCIEDCNVSGCMHYWKCCFDGCDEPYLIKPLKDVYVHLWSSCGGSIASQYTNDEGCYEFACLDPLGPDCYYCVNVDYCPIPEKCITAYDASMILQYLVCLDDLTDCPITFDGAVIFPQMVAADVNCSGLLSAYDASLILQYCVGLIDVFPCPDMWVFYALGGPCRDACPAVVDWIGVLKGDVSGCPECPPGGGLLAAAGPTRVKLGKATFGDAMVEIPLMVTNATGVKSAEFDLSYNTDDFTVVSVQPVGLASGFMCFWNAENGHIFVAMASMSGFNGSGQIAKVTLQKNGVMPSYRGRISIADAMFNEGTPEAVIIGNDDTQGVHRLALGPIAPNPFANGTTINFSMAQSANVSLSIYNVSGQLVTSLVDGVVQAGPQSVAWNGTDFAGNRVARGVYFCRMATEGFSANEKVVLLQ